MIEKEKNYERLKKINEPINNLSQMKKTDTLKIIGFCFLLQWFLIMPKPVHSS